MNFLQRTPFLRLLLAYICGIVVYHYVELFPVTFWCLLSLSIALLLIPFYIREVRLQFNFRWLFGAGVFLLLFITGYVFSSIREKETTFYPLNQKGIYVVELTSAPVEKAKSVFYTAEIKQILRNQHWESAHGKAYLYFQKDSSSGNLVFGDRLMLQTEFKSPEKLLNPDGFDYATYLKRQGVGATAYIASQRWQKIGHEQTFSVRRLADQCRNYLLGIYRKFDIQGNEFGVLAALTLGYTEDLQPDLRKSYSASGATHILSVSGLHVGTVYAVLLFIFGFLNRNQRQKISKIIIITLCMWAYAFLTGLSPSVVRATLMFTFVALANCMERKSQIYNTIFMSAFFMLLVNPNFLFDIGFQLSYLAVLSIIFFQPPLTKLMPTQHRLLKWGRDLLIVSVAAQIGTAPFTLYYFQQFPNYFLLTNLLVIPLSTLVIYLAMGLLAVSFIPYLSAAVAFLLKISVWLLNFCIVQIEHLPYSLSYISPDIRQTILIFVAIFCFSAYYYNKKYVPLAVGFISLLLVCIIDLQVKYNTLRDQKLIVFAGQKSTHVNFIDHGKNYVFSTDSAELERISSNYWRKHKLDKPIYIKNGNRFKDGFTSFYGLKILILTDDKLKRKVTETPLNVDLLIIGNHLKPRMEQILSCVHPKKIIVDKSISNWYANDIRQQSEKQGIEFYSVADQGAYILDITDNKKNFK